MHNAIFLYDSVKYMEGNVKQRFIVNFYFNLYHGAWFAGLNKIGSRPKYTKK